MRVLATVDNVDELFETINVPYHYKDGDGVKQTCSMPAKRCRACGWASLTGVNGLPFPHECGEGFKGMAQASESFSS